MYAAVRRFEGVTDSQKVVQVAKEGFLPIISEMPGFVAYYLVDAGDGVTVSTSVFEHKEAEEQSTFRAGEFVGEHLEPLLPNPPQVTAGKVNSANLACTGFLEASTSLLRRSRSPTAELADTPIASNEPHVPPAPKLARGAFPNGVARSSAL